MLAARQLDPHSVKLLLEAGADVNQTSSDRVIVHSSPWARRITDWEMVSRLPNKELLVGAVVKLLLAAGANVKSPSWFIEAVSHGNKTAVVMLFVAGDQTHHMFFPPGGRNQENPQPTKSLLSGWDDLDLKNQCRKVIRKHLLSLDSHTNLFIQVPQLQMTNERAGLPEKLVSYLLYEQSLDVDWEELETAEVQC